MINVPSEKFASSKPALLHFWGQLKNVSIFNSAVWSIYEGRYISKVNLHLLAELFAVTAPEYRRQR